MATATVVSGFELGETCAYHAMDTGARPHTRSLLTLVDAVRDGRQHHVPYLCRLCHAIVFDHLHPQDNAPGWRESHGVGSGGSGMSALSSWIFWILYVVRGTDPRASAWPPVRPFPHRRPTQLPTVQRVSPHCMYCTRYDWAGGAVRLLPFNSGAGFVSLVGPFWWPSGERAVSGRNQRLQGQANRTATDGDARCPPGDRAHYEVQWTVSPYELRALNYCCPLLVVHPGVGRRSRATAPFASRSWLPGESIAPPSIAKPVPAAADPLGAPSVLGCSLLALSVPSPPVDLALPGLPVALGCCPGWFATPSDPSPASLARTGSKRETPICWTPHSARDQPSCALGWPGCCCVEEKRAYHYIWSLSWDPGLLLNPSAPLLENLPLAAPSSLRQWLCELRPPRPPT